jgi:hypothetical protein
MSQETKIDEDSYEKKVKYEAEVKCPHCQFWLVVKAGKKIIEPATPAVTEDFFTVEESAQSRLETGTSVKDDPSISIEPSDKNNKKDPSPSKKKRGRPKKDKKD